MEIKAISIKIPEGCNVIIGQAHFIKTAEDLAEIIVSTVPQAKYGLAFCEASGPCLIRQEGSDEDLCQQAAQAAQAIGAGHIFVLYLKNAFPINVLNQLKNCSEVAQIFCATANPLQIVVASSEQGGGVLGVIDGFAPKGVETTEDRLKRREFLRKIGYKF